METFRCNKARTAPIASKLSRRQKRAEFKSVQKLVDFQVQREESSRGDADCSKLPTPRSFHTMKKPRTNLIEKYKSCNARLLDRFDKSNDEKTDNDRLPFENDDIWISRNLPTWSQFFAPFTKRKLNLVLMDDIKKLDHILDDTPASKKAKIEKVESLDQLLKKHQEDYDDDVFEEEVKLEDLDLFTSDEEESLQNDDVIDLP